MNRTIARCLYGVLFAGGLTLFGATAAHAADTSGDNGVLSGTAVDTVVSLPVAVGGNAISVLGDSTSSGATSSAAPAVAPSGSSTSGDDALASGSQVTGAVSAPVSIGGNAVSVVGDATTTDAATPAASSPAASEASTSGNDSIAGGTQVAPAIAVPVTVSGNSVAVLGDSTSAGATTPESAPSGTNPATTSGNDSVAGGSQVAPVVTVPVTLGGNAVSVLGDSATAGSTTDAADSSASTPTTSGDESVLGGTQVAPVVTSPVGVGGNAVGLIGDSASMGFISGASAPAESSAPATSVSEAVLGGVRARFLARAPFDVDVAVVSAVGTEAGTPVSPATPATPATDATPPSVADPGAAGAAGVTGDAISASPAASAAAQAAASAGTQVTASAATQLSASAGANLADTGSNAPSFLLGFSALMLLAGVAVTLLGRKRAAQRL